MEDNVRRIPFEHLVNLRDLGGHPAPGGRETAYWTLLRADAPLQLSEAEAQSLADHNVTTIVDLRSDAEVGMQPCYFESAPGFHYHHIPIFQGQKMPTRDEEVPDLYFTTAEEKKSLGSALKVIANAEGGALFHCSAGKDRTGITAALILSLAGVERPDILADYQVSYTYIRPRFEQIITPSMEIPLCLLHSKPEYIDEFLNRLFERYGDAQGYMRAAGLTRDEIQNLRKKILPDEGRA